MAKTITPEEANELEKLWEKLPRAYKRASDALATDGKPLEGEALAKFIDLDGEAGEIVRRITEIQGGWW